MGKHGEKLGTWRKMWKIIGKNGETWGLTNKNRGLINKNGDFARIKHGDLTKTESNHFLETRGFSRIRHGKTGDAKTGYNGIFLSCTMIDWTCPKLGNQIYPQNGNFNRDNDD